MLARRGEAGRGLFFGQALPAHKLALAVPTRASPCDPCWCDYSRAGVVLPVLVLFFPKECSFGFGVVIVTLAGLQVTGAEQLGHDQ